MDSKPTDSKAFSMDDTNAVELLKGGTHNVDEAFAVFQGRETIIVDDATDKRLLRKIDRRILPVMCLIYGM